MKKEILPVIIEDVQIFDKTKIGGVTFFRKNNITSTRNLSPELTESPIKSLADTDSDKTFIHKAQKTQII